MQILHRVIQNDVAIAADGIFQYDMGTNPISVIMLALRPLNETATLGNYARYLNIAAAFNRVTLLHRGASVISGRGEDLAAFNYFRHGILPMEANPDDTDNERRCVILPLLLGRFAYDPRSCFPASLRGELQLELDIDIADTGYDGMRLSIESIELLGATPSEFERRVTTSQTFTATGDNDIFLPTGNVVRGLLAWGTIGFTGAAPAPTLGRLSTMMNGQEVGYTGSDFEVLQAITGLFGRQPPYLDSHTHRVDATAAVTTQETTGPIEQAGSWGNYCFLDFDPTRNDMFSINTEGGTNWSLHCVAETADAARVMSCERMPV